MALQARLVHKVNLVRLVHKVNLVHLVRKDLQVLLVNLVSLGLNLLVDLHQHFQSGFLVCMDLVSDVLITTELDKYVLI